MAQSNWGRTMFKTLSFCAGAVIAFFASPALAQDWRLVTVDDDVGPDRGRSAAGYVDYEGLRRDGPRVTFEMWLVTEQPARSGMDNARGRIEANCPPGHYTYLERVFLRGTEAMGRTGASEIEEAIPNTNAFAIIRAACEGPPSSSARVADPLGEGRAALRARRESGAN
jgi:hypothetical protein